MGCEWNEAHTIPAKRTLGKEALRIRPLKEKERENDFVAGRGEGGISGGEGMVALSKGSHLLHEGAAYVRGKGDTGMTAISKEETVRN